MTSVSVEVEVTGNVRERFGDLRARALAVCRESARQVQALARLHAPRDPARPPLDPRAYRDTGHLRESIQFVEWPDGAGVSVGAEYGVYQEKPYLGITEYSLVYVEIGGRLHAARPFLFPSFEQERPAFIERMREVLR